ncbi:hypothetical protein G7Z17_g2726 [Cylindrodendrum hubeiense]|uniref:Alcohol dehydrogenase iron-type/glycerol dehydrogenase GldA domain-containing protein n=1 Tax=Cylindrodendrum hubeiense TaxID=595255 RepID=A0A9P5HCA0_9HYPO|nr:hypothetical protein G7Z17_g2726 [Cylindrodendrum hubeiense]
MATAESDFFTGAEVHRPAFDNKPKPVISYGLRFPEACIRHVSTDLASSRVFIMASRSLATKTDALERLKKALGDRLAGVRVGMSPHTPMDEVIETVHAVKHVSADCIVTLGAGSITDAAKLVRVAAANHIDTIEALTTLRNNSIVDFLPTMPLICIPTSLSGGEYQAMAAATDPATLAKKMFHLGVEVDLVIQDPELCTTTPQWVWLSSGIRSVDHCVETLCSLLGNEMGDTWSRRGLEKLVPGLLHSKADPTNLHVRHSCQLGVGDAMCAVSSGIPLGGSHAIGHQLGPLGVGHGETSCILLAAVCKYNARKGANVEKQAATARLLLDDSNVLDVLMKAGLNPDTAELGDILEAIIRELGMPTSLEEVGVGSEKLDELARNSLNDEWSVTNAVPLTEADQVLEILNAVLKKK